MDTESINPQKWIEKGYDLIVDFGPKVIAAILIWIIGSWIIKKLIKSVEKLMSKRGYDETIGMALQGSLGNFAGGVLIMIFKPFKIGDLIEAQGELGVVKEIEIFTTKLTGLTNREIIIPNGTLSNGNVINYSTEGTRRVDLTFGVGYDSDIKKTKEVLMNVLTSHPKVLQNPAPTVNVSELADSSINFAVRPWSTADDYWDVYFGISHYAYTYGKPTYPFALQMAIYSLQKQRWGA